MNAPCLATVKQRNAERMRAERTNPVNPIILYLNEILSMAGGTHNNHNNPPMPHKARTT